MICTKDLADKTSVVVFGEDFLGCLGFGENFRGGFLVVKRFLEDVGEGCVGFAEVLVHF